MKGNSKERSILKLNIIILLLGMLIFSITSIWMYSLVIGWIVGFGSMFIGHWVNVKMATQLFKNSNRSKSSGYYLGLSSHITSLLLQVILLIIVIFINKASSGYSILNGPPRTMYYPINIFTYLAGISVNSIATIIVLGKK